MKRRPASIPALSRRYSRRWRRFASAPRWWLLPIGYRQSWRRIPFWFSIAAGGGARDASTIAGGARALLANVSITVSWRGVSRQRTRRTRPCGIRFGTTGQSLAHHAPSWCVFLSCFDFGARQYKDAPLTALFLARQLLAHPLQYPF